MKRSMLVVLTALLTSPVFAQDNSGRNLASTCGACHGTAGKSQGAMPGLAGLQKDYLVKQMQDFKSGAWPATVMHKLAKGFTDEQITLRAEYFSKQKP